MKGLFFSQCADNLRLPSANIRDAWESSCMMKLDLGTLEWLHKLLCSDTLP